MPGAKARQRSNRSVLLACIACAALATATAGAEIKKEKKKKLRAGPIPTIAPTHYPPSPVYLGHADPAPRPYDIYADNCHTAANAFCLARPGDTRRGILACSREATTHHGHHTANWEVRDNGYTCLYNWGSECCWKASQVPPSLDGGLARACAQWACGDQFCDGTRCLSPGELVEIPGYSACVRETAGVPLNQLSITAARFDPADRDRCFGCCDRRADTWDPARWGETNQAEFLTHCNALCHGFFSSDADRLLYADRGGCRGRAMRPGLDRRGSDARKPRRRHFPHAVLP